MARRFLKRTSRKSLVKGDIGKQIFDQACTSFRKHELDKALRNFERAASAGYQKACWYLAYQYFHGEGTPRNDEKLFSNIASLASSTNDKKKKPGMSLRQAQFLLGTLYFLGKGTQRDYAKAKANFLQAASSGHAMASVSLGLLHMEALGCERNFGEAARCFKMALSLDEGCQEASYYLGRLYFTGDLQVDKDYTKALAHFLAAPSNADAMYRVGIMFNEGLGVPRNESKAVYHLRKSAAMDHDLAHFYLGLMFYHGINASSNRMENITDAIDHFYRAGMVTGNKKGNPAAQYYFGMLYKLGIGVRVDKQKAAKWFKQAATGGHPRAQFQIGVCYQYGVGTKVNEQVAFDWYDKSANNGDPKGQCALAYMFLHGITCDRNPTMAVHWYARAAKQSDETGEYALGCLYHQGNGCKKDGEKAAEYFERAAQKGHIPAQFAIGVCYEKSMHKPQHHPQAIFWYRKATIGGHKVAEQRLNMLEKQSESLLAVQTEHDVHLWSTTQVAKYLSSQGQALASVATILKEQQVDGEALLLLNNDDLVKLGIKLGPRKILTKCITRLRRGSTRESPSAVRHALTESLSDPRLYEFLRSANMAHYYKNFADNGINDLQTVATMTQAKMESIGIEAMHAIPLLQNVQSLTTRPLLGSSDPSFLQ